MFRNKLWLSFGVLTLMTLIQALVAFWSHNVASYHVERGRVSNQMLSEFIALGADKQRLKVWLAEFLLLEGGETTRRDQLFTDMRSHLDILNQLAARDQALNRSQADHADIRQQIKVISILETNFKTLERALRTWEIAKYPSNSERWNLLIQTFDHLDTTDLRVLISGAIDLQRQRAAQSEAAAVSALERVRVTVLLLAVLGVAHAIVLSVLLVRALYRPVNALVAGTQELRDGNLAHRLPVGGPSEFAALARQFNRMADHLQRAKERDEGHRRLIEEEVRARTSQLEQAMFQLEQAEQQQRRFFADVSHELRTPATSILGEAEIMLRGRDKSAQEYKESLERIADSGNQLARRIDDLLMLIRGQHGLLKAELSPMTLARCWSLFAAEVERVVGVRSLRITRQTPEDGQWQELLAAVDLDKFLMVTRIVADNALRYSGDADRIELSLALDPGERRQACFIIRDFGMGISPQELERLFDRHFRGEQARRLCPEGLGIGLTIAASIMEALGGEIRIESEVGVGSRVALRIPLAELD